jgi:predicted GNAT superfamily acetyltransferase
LVDILLRPMPGRQGADKIRNLPAKQRLSKGEELIDQTAQRAQERTAWKSHLKGIGVNLLGGIVIAAFGDGGDAAVSTAPGIAIAETSIWTQPSQPIANREDYRRRFPENQVKVKKHWQLVPITNGAMVRVIF